ncbi:hypothetical protein FB451DRAFT_1420710 [Mycena latifolia]|nr:hypothetical protein FB451DRAFT_1420710 [Mycena latifolia]
MLSPSPSSTKARYRAVHVVFALAPGFPSNPSPAARNLASTPRPRAAVSDIGEFLFLYLPLPFPPPFRSASECAVHLLILGRHPDVTGDVQPRFDILHRMPALTHACPRLHLPAHTNLHATYGAVTTVSNAPRPPRTLRALVTSGTSSPARRAHAPARPLAHKTAGRHHLAPRALEEPATVRLELRQLCSLVPVPVCPSAS